MFDHKKTISISELKRLLYELLDRQSYTCIRIRFIGEMWQQDFLRILSTHEDEVIFSNETTGKLLKIKDLSTIMQFELDHNFHQFLAYFHYVVGLAEI